MKIMFREVWKIKVNTTKGNGYDFNMSQVSKEIKCFTTNS